MIKVSVIIPVYNTEKYLRNCLNSIITQTLREIEIICINDGSTDSSLEILREYAQRDDRFVVISQTNKGQSFARNKGIDVARGEYIAFVDSDDYLEKQSNYELLYNQAIISNADIVKGQYKQEIDGSVEFFINEEIKKDKNNFCLEFCSALFKRALINKYCIRFQNICDMEDPIFTFNCAILANKVKIVDNVNYMIVQNIDSATRKMPNYERINDKIYGLTQIINLAEIYSVDKNCYGYVIGLLFASIYSAIRRNNNIIIQVIAYYKLKKIWYTVKYPKVFKENVTKYNNTCFDVFNRKYTDLIFSVKQSGNHKKIILFGIKINLKRRGKSE